MQKTEKLTIKKNNVKTKNANAHDIRTQDVRTQNTLTIDVEDWFQTHDFNFNIADWGMYESRVENSIDGILNLLDKYNVKSTFFILGCIAQKSPQVVKKIADKGHEIASHGGWHKKVFGLTKSEFREDIIFSKKMLEDITGTKVQLYRAPSWSISSDTMWALEILEEEGFICDSSIQPFKTPLSGIKGAPVTPFHPIINGRKLNLIEFPPTVLRVGKFTLPFSGGFYLRCSPFIITEKALRTVNRKRQGMIYIHPWETDTQQPRLKVPFHIQTLHYLNLNTTLKKSERLLQNFEFVTLGELIKDKKYPSINL